MSPLLCALFGHSAFMRPTQAYLSRQLRDPITFVMASHLLLTIIHFITWEITYGVDGTGPDSQSIRTFDDVIVSLMILTGWISLWYFARGTQVRRRKALVMEDV